MEWMNGMGGIWLGKYKEARLLMKMMKIAPFTTLLTFMKTCICTLG
jgi:hypothetical protein